MEFLQNRNAFKLDIYLYTRRKFLLFMRFITTSKYIYFQKIKIIYIFRKNSNTFIMHPVYGTHDELFTFRDSQCVVPITYNCLSRIIG